MKRLLPRIALVTLPIGLAVVALVALMGSEPLNPALRGVGMNASPVSLDPPEDLNFAGEMVPMRDLEVRERLEQELIKNIYLHSATFMNIKRAARWKPEMTAILAKEGIPTDFFYLCVAESHLTNATSPMGAKGFWQFIEATGKNYGLEINAQVDERLDPIKSTYAAAKYIKDAYKVFGNWTLVAASYNMGIGGLQGQLKRQKVSNYYDLFLNRETSAYVFRVLAIKTILERPSSYGFILRPDQLYKPLRYKTLRVDTTISDLVEFAIANGTTYKMVKVMNPWILGDQLKITADGSKYYEIHIPTSSTDPEAFGDLNPKKPVTDTAAEYPQGPHEVSDSAAVDTMPVKTAPSKKKNKKRSNG